MGAVAFAWTLGGAGAHKFYLGQTGVGFLYLLFCPTLIPALLALLEGFSYLSMTDQQFAEHHGFGDSSAMNVTAPLKPLRQTLADGVPWFFGLMFVMLGLVFLTQPEGWVPALIFITPGVCILPPCWKWLSSQPYLAPHVERLRYWGLTVLGATLIISPSIGLLRKPDEWPATLAAIAVGFCLLPLCWEWFSANTGVSQRDVRRIRWSILVLALIVGGVVLPNTPRSASQRGGAISTASSTSAISSDVSPTMSGEWYEGGTLMELGALEWQNATYENKLATCADMVSSAWIAKALKPELQGALDSMDDLRVLADELVDFIDAFTRREPDPLLNSKMYTNQSVRDMGALGIMSMGWAK